MAKQWVILCGDCGTPVIATHNRTRFCKECREKHIAAYRERNKLSKRKPPEEERERLYFYDPPEDIQKCLNCTKEDCTNCLSTPKKGNYKVNHKKCGAHYVDIKHELVECFLAGMLGKEIAIKFNVHPHSVGNWKIKLKEEGLL